MGFAGPKLVRYRKPEWFLDKAAVTDEVERCTTQQEINALLTELKTEFEYLFPGKVYGSHRDPKPKGMNKRQTLLNANCNYVSLRAEFFPKDKTPQT